MARLDWYVRANLKLRHLQLLVALDDYRHLSKVASLLNVTQPALSKTLAELQAGLGARLFERTGRGLKPTEQGTVLIRYARRLLQELADAGDELHALSTGTSRKLRIGTLPASASWLLPQALILLKQREPLASIFVRESTMDTLLTELRVGNLDVIVGTLPKRKAVADLEELPLFDDATALVVRCDHPLTAVSKPSWTELARYPWVMPPADSLLRQPLLVSFGAHGVEPPTEYLETLSINVALRFVQMSSAIGTLPSTLAGKYASMKMIAVLPITLSRLVRPVGMVWTRGQPHSPARDLLADCLRDAVTELHGVGDGAGTAPVGVAPRAQPKREPAELRQ